MPRRTSQRTFHYFWRLLFSIPLLPLLSSPVTFAFSVTAEGIKVQKFPVSSLFMLHSSDLRRFSKKTLPLREDRTRRLYQDRRELQGALHVSNGGDKLLSSNDEKHSLALQGRLLLCLVALLYGTLNVSLRLVYQLPDPPSAAAMSATRGWLGSFCFLPLLFFPLQEKMSSDDRSNTTSSWLSTPLLLAGMELAIWNGLAQGLLNVGLLSTSSARASFLTQTSVLLTPLISLISGQSISQGTWAGCAVALVGLGLLSGAGSMAMAFSFGDILILGGALAWSFYLLRLSQIGSRFDEIQLQFLKTIILAILYSTWFLTTLGAGGGYVAQVATSMRWAIGPGAAVAWGALLFSAVGPGITADVLQQQGQRHVSASEANVLLSMEPVFAAVLARLLLGEVTTVTENVGGGLILLAAFIAAKTTSNSNGKRDEIDETT